MDGNCLYPIYYTLFAIVITIIIHIHLYTAVSE